MIVEISIAVIAAAFVALVIYLIVLIKSLCVTLRQLNQISADMKEKAEALNPVFNAVNQTGQILEHKAAALKKHFEQEEEINADSEETEKKSVMAAAAILELAGMGLSVWQKFKKRR